MKSSKIYTLAGISFLLIASFIMKANASKTQNEGSLIDGQWSTGCETKDGKSFVSLMKFNADNSFTDIGVPSGGGFGKYKQKGNKIKYTYLNLTPHPDHMKLPYKTEFKLEWINPKNIKLTGKGIEKGTTCFAKKTESILGW